MATSNSGTLESMMRLGQGRAWPGQEAWRHRQDKRIDQALQERGVIAFGVSRTEFIVQDVGEAEDRVERRLELVADRGYEVLLLPHQRDLPQAEAIHQQHATQQHAGGDTRGIVLRASEPGGHKAPHQHLQDGPIHKLQHARPGTPVKRQMPIHQPPNTPRRAAHAARPWPRAISRNTCSRSSRP